MNRESSAEDPHNDNPPSRPASFEEIYPRYEFAEMVRIGLVLAEWIAAGASWLAKMRPRLHGSSSRAASKSSERVAWPAE